MFETVKIRGEWGNMAIFTSVTLSMAACKLACGVLRRRVDVIPISENGAYVVNCILGDVKST